MTSFLVYKRVTPLLGPMAGMAGRDVCWIFKQQRACQRSWERPKLRERVKKFYGDFEITYEKRKISF